MHKNVHVKYPLLGNKVWLEEQLLEEARAEIARLEALIVSFDKKIVES